MTQLQPQTDNQTSAQTAAPNRERLEQRPTVAPFVDIFEGKDDILLLVDLPGVKDDELTIEVKNQELTLRARPTAFSDDAPIFDWARAFRLPPGVDVNAVSAELKHGVLSLKLPKPAEHKPRRIEVQVA